MEQHRPATAGGDEKNLSHGVVEESVGGSVAGEKVAGRILDHSHNADAAMKALAEYEGEVLELTEETNKRLLRKIDWHIMPVGSILKSKVVTEWLTIFHPDFV